MMEKRQCTTLLRLRMLSLSKRGKWLDAFCGLLHFLVFNGLSETKSSLLYSLVVCAGVVNKMASPATSMGHTTLLWPQVLTEGHPVSEIKMKKKIKNSSVKKRHPVFKSLDTPWYMFVTSWLSPKNATNNYWIFTENFFQIGPFSPVCIHTLCSTFCLSSLAYQA